MARDHSHSATGELCSHQVQLDELCFVGDRLLTDVVFGNLHGMLTVHTQPLTLKGDNRPAAIFRFLERKVGVEDSPIGRAYLVQEVHDIADHLLQPISDR